jgi:adenylate cyclase
MRESARKALARVEKVIAAEPDHGKALGYGATLLASLDEVERAKEWIERGTLVDPENTILHFNFVCALSRLGEVGPALDLLSSVIDKASKGWLVWLDNDTDLDPLRDDPRFAAIVSKAKARFAAAPESTAAGS